MTRILMARILMGPRRWPQKMTQTMLSSIEEPQAPSPCPLEQEACWHRMAGILMEPRSWPWEMTQTVSGWIEEPQAPSPRPLEQETRRQMGVILIGPRSWPWKKIQRTLGSMMLRGRVCKIG